MVKFLGNEKKKSLTWIILQSHKYKHCLVFYAAHKFRHFLKCNKTLDINTTAYK